ncbi:Prolyl 4-hydroxylase subunit alpha-1 [Paramuricea clavata]|uniref:procollagen-proline 4-dioxygenase n=1 Tax=Paramuricea clavata TaxID=317549 RepID=A0A7D9DKK9_PARCT|nr:Prolyl 4-hydroxylase subunit alpha-1 [Paramuricea clavata]
MASIRCTESELPIYVVNAFTKKPFGGNPAAICLPGHQEIDSCIYQKLAAQMNISETAFIGKKSESQDYKTGDCFNLRWFTPTVEVPLCGHATLASAAVLYYVVGNQNECLTFDTQSGPLRVKKDGEFLCLDMPINKPNIVEKDVVERLQALIKATIGELAVHCVCYSPKTRKLLVRLEDSTSRSKFEQFEPDIQSMMSSAPDVIDVRGVIVTVRGNEGYCNEQGTQFDFVSRYFAPWNGINEDPVTGSAHTVLGSYWSEVLGKDNMLARQCSARGGDLRVSILKNGRVVVAGPAIIIFESTVFTEEEGNKPSENGATLSTAGTYSSASVEDTLFTGSVYGEHASAESDGSRNTVSDSFDKPELDATSSEANIDHSYSNTDNIDDNSNGTESENQTLPTVNNLNEHSENVSSVDNQTNINSVNVSELAANSTNKTMQPFWSCAKYNMTQQNVIVLKDKNSLMWWLDELNKTAGCAVVLFYAKWCYFSTSLAPMYNAVGRAFSGIPILAIDAYTHNSLNTRYGIVGVPTIILFQESRPVARFNRSRTFKDLVEFIHQSTGMEYNAIFRISVRSTELRSPEKNYVSQVKNSLGPVQSNILGQLDDFQPYFPTVEEDLYGSISAIYLLQDTYNISSHDMANGNIPGSSIKNELHADDCFELGSFALYFGRYHWAREWLVEALERVKRPGYNGNIDLPLLLEHASWIEYMTGNLEKALEHCVELIKISPYNTRALDNAMRYRRELKTGLIKTYEHVKADEEKKLIDTYQNSKITKLCREENLRKSHGPARFLKCRYKTDHPILRLKPGKEEVVLVTPRVVIYHDMVRDTDLEKIKNVARPYLQRSKAFNLKTGQVETVSYRISENAWIHENATDAVKIFNRRAEAISGLTMSTAEDLQVANYGLGGQYEEHHDHGYPNSPLINHVNGNRIATMLLYLTSVPYGGGTAFTRLNIYVRPDKGDVVFWYNLKQSGIGDNSTFHAACPVLSGIKWVGNKWFHLRGQEFRRPCTLNEDE